MTFEVEVELDFPPVREVDFVGVAVAFDTPDVGVRIVLGDVFRNCGRDYRGRYRTLPVLYFRPFAGTVEFHLVAVW